MASWNSGNEAMHIIVLGPKPPPTHGVSLNLRLLCERWESLGHRVTFVGTNLPREAPSPGRRGIRDLIHMGKLLGAVVRVAASQREAPVYLACATKDWPVYRDIVLALLLRALSRRLIVHIRGTELAESRGLLRRLAVLAYAKAEKVYGSQGLADTHRFLSRQGYGDHVVPNGVPDYESAALPGRFERPAEELRLLFLSNLRQAKGIGEFIETLRLLRESGAGFTARICGAYSAEYSEARLREALQAAGVFDRVVFCGPVGQAEKRDILADSDVLVFPSHREAFGNVVIEAMSAGVVVVASRTTAMPEILDDGGCGIVLSPFTPAAAAQAIGALSPDRRREIAARARSRYEQRFTLERHADRMLAVLGGQE